MTWTRIGDTFLDREDVSSLSRSAFTLLIEIMVWCNRQQTGGRVPQRMLRRISSSDRLEADEAELLNVRLLQPASTDAYQLDWLGLEQESVEVVAARKASGAKRQREFNERKALHAAGDHSKCTPACPARRKQHNAVTDGVTDKSSNGVSNGVSNASPSPPVPPKGKGRGRGGADAPASAGATASAARQEQGRLLVEVIDLRWKELDHREVQVRPVVRGPEGLGSDADEEAAQASCAVVMPQVMQVLESTDLHGHTLGDAEECCGWDRGEGAVSVPAQMAGWVADLVRDLLRDYEQA